MQSCSRSALVLGHPGHELKAYGFLTTFRPVVSVLTDGSGGLGASRLETSRRLIERVGAKPTSVFGNATDVDIYNAVLHNDSDFFLELVAEVADVLSRYQIEFVAGDACEGYNPTHDLCREIINAAVERVHLETGRVIQNYAFYLSEWQVTASPHLDNCLHFTLNDDLLREKIRMASRYEELRDDVSKALGACGEEFFRVECFRPASAGQEPPLQDGMPFYEVRGRERVAEGKYKSVISYQEHMRPLIRSIRLHTPVGVAE